MGYRTLFPDHSNIMLVGCFSSPSSPHEFFIESWIKHSWTGYLEFSTSFSFPFQLYNNSVLFCAEIYSLARLQKQNPLNKCGRNLWWFNLWKSLSVKRTKESSFHRRLILYQVHFHRTTLSNKKPVVGRNEFLRAFWGPPSYYFSSLEFKNLYLKRIFRNLSLTFVLTLSSI